MRVEAANREWWCKVERRFAYRAGEMAGNALPPDRLAGEAGEIDD